jgi:hypothetical protein
MELAAPEASAAPSRQTPDLGRDAMARVRLTYFTPRDGTPSGQSPLTHRITREGARAIAEQYLASPRGDGLPVSGAGIGAVLRLKEIKSCQPCIYGLPDDRLRACWIAYVARPVRGLASNEVIVIDAETGTILYAGSANDDA